MTTFGEIAIVELKWHFGKRTVQFSELVNPTAEKCGLPEYPTPTENCALDDGGNCISCVWYG